MSWAPAAGRTRSRRLRPRTRGDRENAIHGQQHPQRNDAQCGAGATRRRGSRLRTAARESGRIPPPASPRSRLRCSMHRRERSPARHRRRRWPARARRVDRSCRWPESWAAAVDRRTARWARAIRSPHVVSDSSPAVFGSSDFEVEIGRCRRRRRRRSARAPAPAPRVRDVRAIAAPSAPPRAMPVRKLATMTPKA